MLIEFSVNNYLSIKEAITLNMSGTSSVKELEDDSTGANNVFWDSRNKTKYLKAAVIYGANGSGKSNLLSAIRFYRKFILTSSNDRQADDSINTIPFLFNKETEGAPSSFEMVFVADGIRFRYGFEVTTEMVVSEWLFGLNMENSMKESTYFIRENNGIKVFIKTFKEGKGLEDKTRRNALFLSTVAQLNGEVSNKIQTWLRTNINVISGLDNSTASYSINKFRNSDVFKTRLIDFIKIVDLGIVDIEIEENVLDDLSKKIPKNKDNERINFLIGELEKEILQRTHKESDLKNITINTFHERFDESSKLVDRVPLNFRLESKGTQKVFNLLGPWFDTLENGKVLIIDELDSRLHTKLTIELLKVFQSKLNTKNAQLIFASHDTNLLRKDLFRRDQIWFTEKDPQGATDLYSLVEYKINQATSVRNDASFEKDYLLGKYGAIPYFGDIPNFINSFANES